MVNSTVVYTTSNSTESTNEVNLVFCICLITVGSITVLENLFVFVNCIILLRKRKIIHNFLCGYYLFINLTVADFLVGLASLVESAFRLSPLNLQTDNCLFRVCLIITPVIASFITMTTVSVDRYFAIISPFKYEKKVTKNRTFLFIGFIWVFSITLGSIPYMDTDHLPEVISTCSFLIVKPAYVVFTCFGLFLPEFGLSCYLYIQIFRVSRNHRNEIMTRTQERPRTVRRFSDSHLTNHQIITTNHLTNTSSTRNRSFSVDLPRDKHHFASTFEIRERRTSKSVRYLRLRNQLFETEAETRISQQSITILPHITFRKRLQATFEDLKKRKALRTTSIILFFFISMWSPFLVSSVIEVFTGKLNEDFIGSYLMLFGLSNSAFNPIIYTYTNQLLKRHINKLFKFNLFTKKTEDCKKKKMNFYDPSTNSQSI